MRYLGIDCFREGSTIVGDEAFKLSYSGCQSDYSKIKVLRFDVETLCETLLRTADSYGELIEKRRHS